MPEEQFDRVSDRNRDSPRDSRPLYPQQNGGRSRYEDSGSDSDEDIFSNRQEGRFGGARSRNNDLSPATIAIPDDDDSDDLRYSYDGKLKNSKPGKKKNKKKIWNGGGDNYQKRKRGDFDPYDSNTKKYKQYF